MGCSCSVGVQPFASDIKRVLDCRADYLPTGHVFITNENKRTLAAIQTVRPLVDNLSRACEDRDAEAEVTSHFDVAIWYFG